MVLIHAFLCLSLISLNLSASITSLVKSCTIFIPVTLPAQSSYWQFAYELPQSYLHFSLKNRVITTKIGIATMTIQVKTSSCKT
jgi:hypothetical protein